MNIYIYIYHTAGTMLRTQTYQLFSHLKPGVGQNITWQALTYTAKNYAFIVFAFLDHLASFSSVYLEHIFIFLMMCDMNSELN